PWQLCVAPMMDWTDRHCRYFHRLLAPHARLYTEMITAAALLHGDSGRLLRYASAEHPVALQVAGHEPAELARVARMGMDAGYDEINLNVCCPSGRVQAGRFGAILMLEAGRVADCVRAMREAVDVPVTVKCRLGVDDQDLEAELEQFVVALVDAGVAMLAVHARKAWLKGLSPKQNRTIPPLDHARVHRLKCSFPALPLVVNGGITDVDTAQGQLECVDGVMIGRAAYHDPWLLARLEAALYGTALPQREQVLVAMQAYLDGQVAAGVAVNQVTRHLLGLFQGEPGARRFRQTLGAGSARSHPSAQVLLRALAVTRAIRPAA
ncbi:MAG TPA: tRNA dihydrouridine(20/20a) synthase DusA, partial [Rhodanobacteraceae bacterium]